MADAASGSSHETSTVRYEETLAIKDEEGAGSLLGWVRLVIPFLVVCSLLTVVLVAVVATRGVATTVGGMDVLQRFTGRLVADHTVVVDVFVLAGSLFLLVGVVFVWLFIKNVGRAIDKEIHVRVSDGGVSITRTGSRYWQFSGVDVPFDDITAVEYVHPEESSFRIELGDLLAPKFFGGWSRNWVRLERAHGPAVYVGSDRPCDLAAAIARRVPGDVAAKPY